MATVVYLAPTFGVGYQGLSNTGAPLSGGLINTYLAGTTTPTNTFNSSAGTVANANPLVLDSAGRITSEVWIPAATAIKFAVVDSSSNLIQTYDNVNGINDPAAINGIGVTGATVSGALIMNQAPINEAQGANIPVASAINLTTATGNYLSLTGSGTVTAIQLSQGAYRELVVNSVSCAFQNSATLALVGGSSFTPAVGDILGFRGEAAPVVRQVLYTSAGGSIGPATKAQQQAGTANNVYVSPLHQQDHQSAAKAWVQFDSTGAAKTAYNLTGVTRNSAGNFTITWNPAFNTGVYVVCINCLNALPNSAATTQVQQVVSQTITSCNVVNTRVSDFTQVDPTDMLVVAYTL